MGNDRFQAHFQHTADGKFQWVRFTDAEGRELWHASEIRASSPIDLHIDSTIFNGDTPLRLIGQTGFRVRDGKGLRVVFRDSGDLYEFTVNFEIHPGHAILRHHLEVTNLRATRVWIRANDILPYTFAVEDTAYRTFRVNQWSVLNAGRNFETLANTLTQSGQRVSLQSGAGGSHCSWLAIRKDNDTGFLGGWEFDGIANGLIERQDGAVDVSVNVASLVHPVQPRETYEAPAAFAGVFEGDWDEAGYRTQRYAEAAIAPTVKDDRFPYIAWDSWGYGPQIHETTLRKEVDLAASLGVELFILDLGWAKRMGDWEADPEKFPSGLRAFSDYVHAKGMKLGLHFVISEAMADSAVMKAHPEWACSTNYNYHGALSLAMAHKPVQDWLIEQGVRMIREYRVDWILQDGQTMVKQCTNRNLSYDYRDWNYAGDQALSRIIQSIQAQTPGTVWENCANGGNMMTFRMVRNYVTSITNDASGPLGSRQGLYGASFPFPPRYTDRYMPAGPMTDYLTRSFIFGGPWILMNQLTALSSEELAFLHSEIAIYKQIRESIRDGKVLHLTVRPAEGRIDAIQSYNEAKDEAIAVVTRDDAAALRYTLRFRDLMPEHTYRVSFADDRRVLLLTGRQLMDNGVSVLLPERESGEIVYARRYQ